MNLIEAIKSGKLFRCTTWSNRGDYWISPNMAVLSQLPHTTNEELAGDDWEIQEPTVTITRTQFWDAARAASSAPLGRELVWSFADMEKLARKLGLGGECDD